MGNGLIAFMVAVGVSVWVYGKIMRSTGSNTKNSLIVAGSAAVIIFIILIMLLKLVPTN